MRTYLLPLVMALSCSLVGCGGSDCPESGTGTLVVEVSGLPEGILADVAVIGPGTVPTVGATQILESVAGGKYLAQPSPVAAPGGLIRRAFDAGESQSTCVKAGQSATLSVTYAQIPSSAKLWTSVTNGDGQVEAFGAELLGASGTVSPTVVMTSEPSLTNADGVAFDKRGNLWVAAPSGTIRRYRASDLGTFGEKRVELTISGLENPSPGPSQLAFDGAGNLWVTLPAADKVVRFSPQQLQVGGPQIGEVEVTGLDGPLGLAFDAAGNLWVGHANGGAADLVNLYAAARLTASISSADASFELRRPSTNFLNGPFGLAFDAEDNLWISYSNSGVIARLTPAERTGTGSQVVTPAVQLQVSGTLDGLAFDEEGHLWTPYGPDQLGRIAPAQLAASATVVPQVVVTSQAIGSSADALALFPAPANLPLYHRLP